MIKLIGFSIYGHYLFEDGTYFTLQTGSQVTKQTEKRVIRFNKNLTLNRVIGVVGINATGKSTLMEIFDGLNSLYLLNQSIDQTKLDRRFRSADNKIKIIADLASSEDDRFVVVTTFEKVPVADGVDENAREWVITDEQVYHKRTARVSKKNYFRLPESQTDSQALDLERDRKKLSAEQMKLLSEKDSIFRAVDRPKGVSMVISTVPYTDENKLLTFLNYTPMELLTYLDNSIEYLNYEKDDQKNIIGYTLKFKDADEVIHVADFKELRQYLSSGTTKGITLFFEFLTALRSGATLMVDEIELHINKQIARDFIGFLWIQKLTLIVQR